MLRKLPIYVNSFSDVVANKTGSLVDTKYGNFYLRIIVLLGPVFFIPTIWEVWTSANIDSFKTPTWSLMLIVHIAAFIILSHHKSDWCVRFCTVLWFFMTASIVLATIVR